MNDMNPRRGVGLAGVAAAVAAIPVAAAYRFAILYRNHVGHPRRIASTITPGDLDLPYEDMVVPSIGLELPARFITARGGQRGPGVVVVHGWESAMHRSLPMARFLHAAGFHVLVFDVRGHGANPPEKAPITAAEFGSDAAAAVRSLAARPEIDRVGVVGHSMGAVGALLAAAREPVVAAVVAVSTPADPYRLTRMTFRIADLPFPDPIAYPLAWLTARVYASPRGHRVEDTSATAAIRHITAPVLLVHGDADQLLPIEHLDRLVAAAPAATDSHVVAGGGHSWLYEDEGFRRSVAAFLARWLGGPQPPDKAADLAAAVDVRRIEEPGAPQVPRAIEEAPSRSALAAGIAGVRRLPGERR